MWKKGELYINVDSVNGVSISKVLWAYYWATGNPLGYLPGGVRWQDILEGCGTHYVLNFDEDQGMFLNANTHFFLETPILGEIDWRYTCIPGAKPRSGYFKVDVLDVVKVTGAYCSRGDGTPPPQWNVGADIDPSDVGHVGILDLVQVNNNYGKTFGIPPP